MNVIPLAVGIGLWVLHAQGKIEFKELPAGFTTNAVVAGGALLALALVASASLPVAHGWVRSVEGTMRLHSDRLIGRAEGSRIVALLSLPFLFLGYVLAWPIRAVLIVLSFALIAVVGIFVVRMARPDFLEEWIQKVIAYRF